MPRHRCSDTTAISISGERDGIIVCSLRGLACLGVGVLFIGVGLTLVMSPGEKRLDIGSVGVCIMTIGSLMVILTCVFIILPSVCSKPEKFKATSSLVRPSQPQTATTEFSNNISTRTNHARTDLA